MSNKRNNDLAFSSTITIATLILACIFIIFIPSYFHTPPANLKNLILYLTTLASFLFFCLLIIRRNKLFLSFSPLFPHLITLIFVIFLTTIYKNFTYPEKSFLGPAGQMISFSLIAICASFLIKAKNNQILVKTLIAISLATSLITFGITLNHHYSFISPTLLSIFSGPSLNYNLLFLGLASLFSYFFKKNKFKPHYYLFLIIIIAGLIFNTYLYFSNSTVLYSNFQSSLTTISHQTTNRSTSVLKQILFGSSAQQYSDNYYSFHLSDGSFYPIQSISTPLTIFSLFGFFSLAIWLSLIIKTAALCFTKKEENQHLYFILLISFIVQLFTPIYPLILLIQATIIAFAVNKNKKTLINIKFSTFFDHLEKKSYSSKDKSKAAIYSILFFACLSLLYATFKIGQSYLGYYYHHQALKQENSLNQFYRYSQNAVEVAPFIDTFNRFASIANLEIMLEQINRHADSQGQAQALQHFNYALTYAQKAIAIEPYNANNHQLLAGLYYEILPFLATENRPQAFQQVAASLAQAVLLQPKNQELHLLLGGLYHSQGNLEEAKKIYLISYQLNPNHLLTNYQLGILYAQQNEFALAKTHYQNALNHLDLKDENYSQNHQILTQRIANLP